MRYQTKAELIAFEQRIKARFAAGELPFLVHLSGGNEDQLIEIFREVNDDDWVLSNHRNHYHALLKGIPPEELERLICEGRSMFVYSREHKFVTSAILAGVCSMAAGVALALKQSGSKARVFCFLGDGAEDNGHTYEAIRFATMRDLPIQFVIEDNNRQVDTSYRERWGVEERFSWRLAMPHQACKVYRYRYEPTFPHGGAGLPPGSVTFNGAKVAQFAIHGHT
jgi:TPP-dependent pyruvate/acetoin dehydrogenase alpha subunit